MDTPHFVDVTERPQLEFRRHPHKSIETDPAGALSSVPYGVLHVEDIRSYIHCKLEDLGTFAIFDQYRTLCDKQGVIKDQFRRVTNKGFHHAMNFLDEFEGDHIRYVLSKIHNQFMWLDRAHKITKEDTHAVTGLWATGEVPVLRTIPKNEVARLTKSKWDGRAMTINEIEDPGVKYSSMVIGYRVYHSSRTNGILGAAIHTAYQMVKENADYDLAEALITHLILNLESIKKDKRQKFKFGQLIIGLFFYFQNSFPSIGDIQWSMDTPAMLQIKNSIKLIGNEFTKVIWRYFKDFQKRMHERERIPEQVVKRYEDTICFMVDTDTCQMEAADPRTSWVMPMGYEVEADLLIAYADHLLEQPVDSNATRFGTFKEKSIEVHSELAKLVIAKKVRKEVEQFVVEQGYTKEEIVEAKAKFEAKKAAESSSAPTGTSTGRQTRSTAAKEKPSKIQFKRKGKEIKPPAPKALVNQ